MINENINKINKDIITVLIAQVNAIQNGDVKYVKNYHNNGNIDLCLLNLNNLSVYKTLSFNILDYSHKNINSKASYIKMLNDAIEYLKRNDVSEYDMSMINKIKFWLKYKILSKLNFIHFDIDFKNRIDISDLKYLPKILIFNI